MVRIHDRSPSPAEPDSLLKRLKTTHDAPQNDPTAHFAPNLLSADTVQTLHQSYHASEPYKYVVIDKLFDDELLRNVKDECIEKLAFTEKETDIYKVNQTGDLASLSYLSPTELALFQNLLTLRNALYSPAFRKFLRAVTGCGPLSGSKQDMSVNSYTTGCHLLNHDDVIGTRRVSYILYMPLPHTDQWKAEYGGALELYPTRISVEGADPEPIPFPSKSIPPAWNQFVFFEVQPGKSFHSVQEVVATEPGVARLSISGWFHAAQPGEDDYSPDLDQPIDSKSSREQLVSGASTPFTPYETIEGETAVPDSLPLTAEHLAFLSRFLSPVYLRASTLTALAKRFVDESSLELHQFLAVPSTLEDALRATDKRDGLGLGRSGQVPSHEAGTGDKWDVKGPPHKWRYCTLRPTSTSPSLPPPLSSSPSHTTDPNTLDPSAFLPALQSHLFPSPAFRAWLAVVTSMFPLAYSVQARRFRPGLDYTLATSEEDEARLDVVLGLTPDVTPKNMNEGGKGKGKGKGKTKSKGKGKEEEERGWQTGEWGGWECYMAPHDEEDDPAVYRSSSTKSKPTSSQKSNDINVTTSSTVPGADADADMDSHANGGEENPVSDAEEEREDDDDDDDATLLTVQPGFNRLLLVLRDARVMRFVKYVSAAAEGSRWDVCGEFEVGVVEEEEEEEGEEEEDDEE
ncbi:hypothetical protein SERLA73DRAFT_159290 [Serpula lacrymans var. lacrymans S7.3]|uniref:uS12 prolyl 3,4-dihydroxylase n=2 Tax=Serpula lacrymans var. lacrymans TaxID=341189 RepID=F8PR69_SERL3|nr:uncharacterized protein SERLADRAFT_360534 [Serpula lacrymans var. lacrymans S7.9]EGO02360.1 hypothetical protein SERLA73DRAFT_159290 [Serpula lacrymans var. lacrymans S7.3]EGO28090.1 hypothetical protein SERLADRAFT_360534 [Serpula lacrymans var. lacrymans S7.9]